MDSFELTKIAGAVLSALLLIFGLRTVINERAEFASELARMKPGYTLPGGEAPKAAAKSAEETKAPEAKADAKSAEAGKSGSDAKSADTKGADAKSPAKTAEAEKNGEAKPEAKPETKPEAKSNGSEAAAASPAAAVVAAFGKADADSGKAIFKKCLACHTIDKGAPKAIGPNLWGVVNRPKASFPGFEYSPGMKAKGGNWTFEDLAQFISKPKAYVSDTKMVFAGLSSPGDAADVIAYLATQNDTPVPLPK